MAITPLPTPAPSRDQPEAEFVANANALFGALPTMITQINAESAAITDERELAEQAVVDAQAQVALAAGEVDQAEAFAVAAQNSALIASGAANYKGEYSAGTTYQIGQTVSYNGAQFVAKTVNTGVTPVDGANWLKIENGDVIGPASATANALAIFDGTTGKLLKSPIGTGTAGQALVSGGTGAIPEWATIGILSNYQEFTSSGTWTKPAGATWIYIEAIGGGGSGRSATAGAGGGGGGLFVSKIFRAAEVGATETITIGAGGASAANGANGNDGGDTTFGSLLTANGGAGATSPIGGFGGKIIGHGLLSSSYVTASGNPFGAQGGLTTTGGVYGAGNSIFGGAGGGSAKTGTGAGAASGGTSLYGGNGGAGAYLAGENGQNGSVPGGGGGACASGGTSGSGGSGRVRIWAW